MSKPDILERFPKTRPPLPKVYQDIYETHYKSNRAGDTSAASLSQKMEAWMHKKVAADLYHDDINIKTLEIGAGTLNQIPYEYKTQYDIIEPFRQLFKQSSHLSQVNTVYNDICDINNKEFDRITSIATFEHITNLPYVVAKTCLLLKDKGVLRTAIPNEGTILWKLGWMLTTGLEFKIKYKQKYSTLLYYEHVNNADEIEYVLNYFYNNVNSKVFGVHKKLGLYRFYECKAPKFETAEKYFEQQKTG